MRTKSGITRLAAVTESVRLNFSPMPTPKISSLEHSSRGTILKHKLHLECTNCHRVINPNLNTLPARDMLQDVFLCGATQA